MAILDTRQARVLVIDGKPYKARVFSLTGRQVELYPIRVLARALDRTPTMVTLWEKANLIPQAIFRLKSQEKHYILRWYSREQIINLHQVMNRFPFSAGYNA